jgi:hypothetical protein
MGAYDSELYSMGYRFTAKIKSVEIKSPTERDLFLQQLHVAIQPCIGHCGNECLNHWCNAHNSRFVKS